MAALKRAFNADEMGRVRKGIQAGDLANPLERAEELEENIERERSWWYGLDDALKDERREMRADIEVAGLDAQMTPAEARRLRQTEKRTAGALEDLIKMRDAATELASQIVGFAIGLLVTAVTAGAAGPLVIGTLVRAAVVSAIARVLTDKALKGDRFDLLGGDGARSFGLGAVDGVMAVLGGRGASSLLGRIGGAEVAVALEKGTAGFALKTVHTAVEGGMGGGVSSVVDATANEQTWKKGVFEGLAEVIDAGLRGTGQGAGMSVGTHAAIHGAKAGGGALADRIKGRRPGGAHDPGGATAREGAGTGGERGTTTAAGMVPENPLAGLSPAEKGAAARMILDQFGAWEHAIGHLQRGTDLAAGMHPETRQQLIDALVEHRAHVLADVRAKFAAEPVGGASKEPGSDADLNVRGDDAGQKLIAAREYLTEHYPGWERHYRMALLIDAGRVGAVGDHLASLSGPEQARVKQQVDARVLHQSELLATARQVRQLEPGPAQEQLLNRLPAADRARVQELATMDAKTRQQAHDTALLEGDALAKRLRGETDPAERLRLAEESTYKQMLANMLNDEAYITPGAVGEFVSQKPVATASERYQASLDQVLMISHQAHAAGGVLAAMRRYEIFKYISRYCELLEGSGLALDPADKAKLTWFKNWSEYVYRVEREATGSATAVEGRQVAGGAPKAGTRLDAEPGDVRPGAPEKFLLDNYQDFKAFADRHNGKLRGEAQVTTAPGAPGGPAGPNAATQPGLLDLPALTDADHAAAAGSAKAGPDAGPGASAGTTTAAAGTKVAAAGTTPLLGARAHEPIGNPLPNEKAARALIRRLASGDATALHDAGVTNVPPNYDPRGREWGVGRRADGTIVLIEGGPQGVDWEAFIAQGGHPLSHSHPMTTGREMKAPGKTMFELIPGTSVGNPDAIHVLPSVEDFIFCYENGLEVHDVHTPYVHQGGGKISNLDPANPQPGVSFQIVGTMHVGDTPVGAVLRSMLVAYDAHGNVLGMQPVYVVAHPRLNGIRLEPPDRMIAVETAAGAGQVPGQPAGGRTKAGATATPTGSVPPWREALAKHAPDAAASDALVHAFGKDLPRLENLVEDVGAPAVHALTAEVGGPAKLEALSRDVGITGLKNLARDLKGPEIEALVKAHGAEQVKWAAAELHGNQVNELLALPKAELAALSQPPAAGGVTGAAAHRLLTALEAGRLKQLIPAVTPVNLSTILELLGPASTRDLADVKIKSSNIPDLNEHGANLASQRPRIDAPAALAANSLMVDSNTMIAIRKLMTGADWDHGLQPIERNAINAVRRRMTLTEFDTSSPPPVNADGTRELAGLVGTTDLRGPNAVLSELDATAHRPAGVALGVGRDTPDYAQVIADLSDLSQAKEGRIGKNKGAEDRAAIADALFAAQPPGASGDPVFMTADGDVFTRLIPWAIPPVTIPPKFPTMPGEHNLTYAQRFAFQNRNGFTVVIRGRRLHVIPVSE